LNWCKSSNCLGTGWCTAGHSTAKIQINSGDFYVYYTFDKNNEPSKSNRKAAQELLEKIEKKKQDQKQDKKKIISSNYFNCDSKM
jgi:hypothetical protein